MSIEKLSYLGEHHGGIQTREHEVITSPGPQNLFSVVFQNSVYLGMYNVYKV